MVVGHVPQVLLEPHVRIRPRLEQRRHDVEVGGFLLIVRAGLRIARPRRPLQVERREQRRGPPVGGDVGIGAALDQPQRQIEVAVHGGDLQRARLVAAHPIDVGPGVEQGQRHLGMTLAGRMQQGRQPALAPDPFGVGARGAAFQLHALAAARNVVEGLHLTRRPDRGLHLTRGGPPPLLLVRRRRRPEPVQHLLPPLRRRPVHRVERGEIDDPRSDVEICAALHQHVHRSEPVGRGGEHQRGLSPGPLPDVHVRSMVEQGGDGRAIPRLRGQVERSRPARRRGVRVGAGLEQRPHHRRLPAPARDVQRRMLADAGRRLEVRAGIQEHLGHLEVAPHCRPVQRGHAVGPRRLHVGAPFEQGLDGPRVAPARGIRHRRIDRRRGDHRPQGWGGEQRRQHHHDGARAQ